MTVIHRPGRRGRPPSTEREVELWLLAMRSRVKRIDLWLTEPALRAILKHRKPGETVTGFINRVLVAIE